eukprot:1160602-Pelagomonas_calceolata.AAC.5
MDCVSTTRASEHGFILRCASIGSKHKHVRQTMTRTTVPQLLKPAHGKNPTHSHRAQCYGGHRVNSSAPSSLRRKVAQITCYLPLYHTSNIRNDTKAITCNLYQLSKDTQQGCAKVSEQESKLFTSRKRPETFIPC